MVPVSLSLEKEIMADEANTDAGKSAPKERTMEVLLLRGYFHKEGEQIDAGTVVELPEAEAKAAIRNGLATFPDED